ncbi:hypothetical protein Sliba_63490 [Streptomyces nigrescens]|uniref:Uncharacterized protein n=1 Tax=Streptomyces nigrescens TaxID=1920 RepID=A0A640TUS7_STRNI|nr:hypothetical protein Sliba_63490 [Streptomyces libani subsp. libani]GGW03562.1 hypothetical protein GCM10010500_63580 [Streptomyces libani subsp. libani]
MDRAAGGTSQRLHPGGATLRERASASMGRNVSRKGPVREGLSAKAVVAAISWAGRGAVAVCRAGIGERGR